MKRLNFGQSVAEYIIIMSVVLIAVLACGVINRFRDPVQTYLNKNADVMTTIVEPNTASSLPITAAPPTALGEGPSVPAGWSASSTSPTALGEAPSVPAGWSASSTSPTALGEAPSAPAGWNTGQGE